MWILVYIGQKSFKKISKTSCKSKIDDNIWHKGIIFLDFFDSFVLFCVSYCQFESWCLWKEFQSILTDFGIASIPEYIFLCKTYTLLKCFRIKWERTLVNCFVLVVWYSGSRKLKKTFSLRTKESMLKFNAFTPAQYA